MTAINILKPSQLAKCLDMSNASITMAVKNKQIIMTIDRNIDVSVAQNKSWIEKQVSKGKTFDINRALVKTTSAEQRQKQQVQKQVQQKNFVDEQDVDDCDESYSDEDVSDIPSNKLYDEKLRLEIVKLRNQDTKDKLQIAKLQGDLIPTSVVENIFLWAANNFKKTFEQDIDSLINVFVMRLGGNQRDFIDMKKESIVKLANAGQTLTETMLIGLESAVKEYSEVRGRGERK